LKRAEYGDVIYTKHGLYRHYGIYINENCVIHYDGKIDDFFLREMCIIKTTMDRFLDGNSQYYIDKRNSKFDNDEVVKRATQKIGEEKFNLIFNNCEHFSMWCKADLKTSKQ
jgi:hypothetical protein